MSRWKALQLKVLRVMLHALQTLTTSHTIRSTTPVVKKAADAYRHQAALLALHAPERAMEAYENCLRLDQDNKEVEHALEQLRMRCNLKEV